MNTIGETFDKSERLSSRKIIETLFENGNVFYIPLFKIVWQSGEISIPGPAQVAFSVSKRGFRLAVTRNLIKRRMREAYRKNKGPLYNHLINNNIKIVFVIIVRGKDIPEYVVIEKAIKDMINKLILLTGRKMEVGSRKKEIPN